MRHLQQTLPTWPSIALWLEPPGPFGLNHGHATPATTLLAQVLFGVIFSAGFALTLG